MTTPAVALQRFLIACLLGAVLGLYYGFLRPLRPKHTHISDFLFAIGIFWAWLQLSFGVCQGDIRLAYTAGLAVGAVLWESTVGRLLRPLFQKFWWVLGQFLRLFLLPFKIFIKKAKKYCIYLLLN